MLLPTVLRILETWQAVRINGWVLPPTSWQNERRTERSHLGLAIAMVVDQRRWYDWAWLGEDTALDGP